MMLERRSANLNGMRRALAVYLALAALCGFFIWSLYTTWSYTAEPPYVVRVEPGKVILNDRRVAPVIHARFADWIRLDQYLFAPLDGLIQADTDKVVLQLDSGARYVEFYHAYLSLLRAGVEILDLEIGGRRMGAFPLLRDDLPGKILQLSQTGRVVSVGDSQSVMVVAHPDMPVRALEPWLTRLDGRPLVFNFQVTTDDGDPKLELIL